MMSLLEVNHLSIFVKQQNDLISVVKDISFKIEHGECVGIVGESGSGKSLTAQTIACLGICPFEGEIILEGESIIQKSEKEKRNIRAKKIGMIFQNPQACFNPTMKMGEQIREVDGFKLTKNDVLHLMSEVGLLNPERCYGSYPHELSGGMCQRVMIALAIARKPALLIADEPTTALDVGIQMQILDLLKKIQKNWKTSTLLITHDFGVVERLCQRVLVMYAGEIVEEGSIEHVLNFPQHPYTQALLASRPKLGKGKDYPLVAIPGRPPTFPNEGSGCSFQPRCSKALPICALQKPSLIQLKNSKAACWHQGLS